MTDYLFLGSKITADSDCSHEIRRQLLLGRKAMTNLDRMLKSRDITLPTEVKAMVFPVVSNGCENWTIKKEAVVHIHNGILLNHKKECIWVSSDEVDEPRTYYTEWSESEREREISYSNTHIWNILSIFNFLPPFLPSSLLEVLGEKTMIKLRTPLSLDIFSFS